MKKQQLSIRLPESLLAWGTKQAKSESNSFNGLVLRLLKEERGKVESPNCTGLDGSHGYADHACPNCGKTVCSDCASFDSRGDSAHDANHPVLECPDCGTNVL